MPTTRTLPRGRGSSPLPLLLSRVESLSTTSPESTHQRREEQPSLRIYRAHHTPGKHWEGSLTLLLSSTESSFVAPSLPYHHICIIHPRVTKLSSSTIRPHMSSNPFFTNQHHHCQYYFIHTHELPSLHASLHILYVPTTSHPTKCLLRYQKLPANLSGRGAKPCKQAQKAHSFTHLHIKNTPSNHISKTTIGLTRFPKDNAYLFHNTTALSHLRFDDAQYYYTTSDSLSLRPSHAIVN
mmetsp:Transcript_22087/g.52282  ORF Transcript_22087/g.52282 Transcript_22087/m.52282 type:complete len:239 (-) Transcript_22087:103-819(-)